METNNKDLLSEEKKVSSEIDEIDPLLNKPLCYRDGKDEIDLMAV